MIQFATIIAARGRRQRRSSSFLHGRLRCHKIRVYSNNNRNNGNNGNIIIKSDNITAKGSSSSWRCRCRVVVAAVAIAISFSTAPEQYGDIVARVAVLETRSWGLAVSVYPVLCVPRLVLQPNLWVVAFVKLFHICLSHRGCFVLHYATKSMFVKIFVLELQNILSIIINSKKISRYRYITRTNNKKVK